MELGRIVEVEISINNSRRRNPGTTGILSLKETDLLSTSLKERGTNVTIWALLGSLTAIIFHRICLPELYCTTISRARTISSGCRDDSGWSIVVGVTDAELLNSVAMVESRKKDIRDSSGIPVFDLIKVWFQLLEYIRIWCRCSAEI